MFCTAFAWAGDHAAGTGHDDVAEHHGHGSEGHGDHGHSFYVVPKIQYSLGDEVHHTDGDNAFGFGIDFGFRVKGPFSIELSGFMAEGDAEETEHHEHLEVEYRGYGVKGVYAWHVSDKIAVPLKLGWIHETEEVDDGHGHIHSASDDGIAYAAGIEYILTDRTALLFEVEGTSIDSPKGMDLFFGVSFGF